jgi:hypothetical protein
MQHIASVSWYRTMPFLTSPLQNPTLGEYRPRTANRALVHRRQGLRHRDEDCVTLRW